MKFYSPLRYPGGKGKLVGYVKKIMEYNSICDGIYVEPFAGGAGIALSLLFCEYVKYVVINDIDKSIYAFWYSVINYTDRFCKKIYDTDVTIEEWKYQRSLQNNKDSTSIFDLGFSTFFLNRTNRSGIIKGGVIGGLKQTGKWKMDARFNKEDLIKRIERIALYKDRIKLYNLPAEDLITTKLDKFEEESIIYFDPPYYNKGPELYENYYNPEDHENLASLIKNIYPHRWLLTYDYTEEVKGLYSNFRWLVYNLNYSAGNKYEGSEIMIFSNNLRVPDIKDPVKCV